ncbi:hypothetical protein N7512_001303 [Penicillium capsulatum]|nr:hypothetical protein N7512_001303 [Penicillium capsulatum]
MPCCVYFEKILPAVPIGAAVVHPGQEKQWLGSQAEGLSGLGNRIRRHGRLVEAEDALRYSILGQRASPRFWKRISIALYSGILWRCRETTYAYGQKHRADAQFAAPLGVP